MREFDFEPDRGMPGTERSRVGATRTQAAFNSVHGRPSCLPPKWREAVPGLQAVERQRRRLRAVRMVAAELVRRLTLDRYGDGLVLALTGRTDACSNLDAVEQWVALVLVDVERPNLTSLARQLQAAIEDGVASWT
ncbi:MAG TPA: hypothetical protein VFQ88_10205 [Nevskiaceae bacterium]|nr:hypothetical protein [Nevskiaceae bacterium]